MQIRKNMDLVFGKWKHKVPNSTQKQFDMWK